LEGLGVCKNPNYYVSNLIKQPKNEVNVA
jgi:hypothetical protein